MLQIPHHDHTKVSPCRPKRAGLPVDSEDLRNELTASLETIYDRHEVELFACALSIARCRELAADAIHDAFSRLLAMDRHPINLKAYVFRSVQNAALRLLRQKRPQNELPDEPFFDAMPNVDELAIAAEDRVQLNHALELLSESQRRTILLHIYSGLTFQEIAVLDGESVNTVASWYRRGLTKLRHLLEKEQGEW